MMWTCTSARLIAVTLVLLALAACGSDRGSRSEGTRVQFQAVAMPVNTAMLPAGPKTFVSDLGHTITLHKAWLVVADIELVTDCSGAPVFSLAPLLNMLLPAAHAHSTSTPTSTGDPYVVDLLRQDDSMLDVGELNPVPADYCGAVITLAAADGDTANLPLSQAPGDMVGLTVYIEGSYNGGNAFTVSTGASLPARNMLLSPALGLSADNISETLVIEFNYDTWFDGIDPAAINNTVLLQNILDAINRR